jgi:archaellum component FlaC
VLEDIRKNAMMATRFENRYLKQLMDADSTKQKKQLEKDKKEIEAIRFRIADLDKIIKKLYEDNALGKIQDKRFTSLSDGYEKEQQELAKKLELLEEKVKMIKENADKTQQFLGFIRKYTDIENTGCENPERAYR